MYEVATRAMGYVLRFRNPTTAGFRAAAPYDDQEGPSREDLILTAFGGLDCITLGHQCAAEGAGDWVCRLFGVQPNFNEGLYLMWRPDDGVVREVPEGHDRSWCLVEPRLEGQDYYNLGVALLFLSHLYRLTGNKRYLKGAEAYYEFFESCQEDRLRSVSSGKVMYGLSWLYLATGDRHYIDEACTAANYLVEAQGDEGYWCQHGGPYLNITAEYAFELHWFIQVRKMLS